MDDKEQESCIAHQHMSHFSDSKHQNKVVDDMTVNIGTKFDWSNSLYKEDQDIAIDGTICVDKICAEHDSAARNQVQAVNNLVISTQRTGDTYDVENMSDKQRTIVYAVVDTVIKFLNNGPKYRPMRANVIGCGGTGKSFIVNTIISMVRKLTCSIGTVHIAVSSGATTFNVQGSTIHNLLQVRMSNLEKGIPENTMARLLE